MPKCSRPIAGLERDFDVRVITQNVDNLHERAGSTHILHLHGELTKLRSTDDPSLILPFDGVEQGFDDRAPDGSLLRPHIVFFGEPVPEFDRAAELAAGADILMVVGTSLAVYPAASLVRCVRPDIPVYVVDPGRPAIRGVRNPLEVIRKRAAEGVPELADHPGLLSVLVFPLSALPLSFAFRFRLFPAARCGSGWLLLGFTHIPIRLTPSPARFAPPRLVALCDPLRGCTSVCSV